MGKDLAVLKQEQREWNERLGFGKSHLTSNSYLGCALAAKTGTIADMLMRIDRVLLGLPGGKSVDPERLSVALGKAFSFLLIIAEKYNIDLEDAWERAVQGKT